eukprot:1883349-Rhodomonas_salina.3
MAVPCAVHACMRTPMLPACTAAWQRPLYAYDIALRILCCMPMISHYATPGADSAYDTTRPYNASGSTRSSYASRYELPP